MSLQIGQVGSFEGREYLTLDATDECGLEHYMLLRSQVVSDSDFALPPEFLRWLPAHPMEAGDQVVIWTGHGENRVVELPGRHRVHIYLGRDRHLWTRPAGPVLAELSNWDFAFGIVRP